MVELTQFKPTERSSIERTSIQDINFRGTNAASPRMTGAPAEEEIDSEAGMQLVEERAPNGFSRIEDVISRSELESIAKSFSVAAGLDPEIVNSGPSFVPSTSS
jgi:hypothetical protein